MQHCFSTARLNPTSPPRLRHSPMTGSSRCPTAAKQADASPRRSRDPILGALPGRASGSQRRSSSKSITNGRRNGAGGHISAEVGRDITPANCPPGPRSGWGHQRRWSIRKIVVQQVLPFVVCLLFFLLRAEKCRRSIFIFFSPALQTTTQPSCSRQYP